MPTLTDTTSLKRDERSAQHWYTAEGLAQHKVERATGTGLRNTNITDARKLGLLPSVTSVFKVSAKPQLERWKTSRIVEASMNHKPAEGENLESYTRRLEDFMYDPVSDAAKLGSYGHDAIDRSFEGTPVPPELLAIINPFFAWLKEKGMEVTEREKTLTNLEEGYAGTVDLMFTWGPKGQRSQNQGILDFKFKDTIDKKKGKPKKIFIPDDYGMQIAAYGVAAYGEDWLDNPNALAANVILSTTEPGRMEVKKWDDLRRHYEGFKALLGYWIYCNKYNPRKQNATD